VGVHYSCSVLDGVMIRLLVGLCLLAVLSVAAPDPLQYWSCDARSCESDVKTKMVTCKVKEKYASDTFALLHGSLRDDIQRTDAESLMIFASEYEVVAAHLMLHNDQWNGKGFLYNLKTTEDTLNIILMDYALSSVVAQAIGYLSGSYFGKEHPKIYLETFMHRFSFVDADTHSSVVHHGWYNRWDQDETVLTVAIGTRGTPIVDVEPGPAEFVPGPLDVAFVLFHCVDDTRHGDECDDYDMYVTGFERDREGHETAKRLALNWLNDTHKAPGQDYTFHVVYRGSWDVSSKSWQISGYKSFKLHRPLKLKLTRAREHFPSSC